MPTFSIITCTYNGATRLPETIRHLAALQTDDSVCWEWLLILNACTDETEQVSRDSWETYKPNVDFSVYVVPNPGKSYSLAFAIQKARGKYVIICDDDNRLPSDYLQIAYGIMERHPEYGIVGGRAEAVSDIEIPEWFYEVQYAYACGSPASVSADLTGRYFLWGAGMVIRKDIASIIINTEYPTILTGRRGNLLTAGEDDEKCVRAWFLGCKTWFDYRLCLYHYIPAQRLTNDYKSRLLSGFGEQGSIIGCYRRLFELTNHRNRTGFFLKQLITYWLATLSRNKTRQRIAGDYLYFLTKRQYWETSINKEVQRFFEFAKKCIK